MIMEIKIDYLFCLGGLVKGFIYRFSNDNSCYVNDFNIVFFLIVFFFGIKVKDGWIV